MDKVGQSKNRNQKYFKKFSREIVIKNIVNKEDPICLDVGAHNGESVVYFNKLFNSPLIYSFEASPTSFEILKNKNYKNNFCYNYAISNITGNTVFYENEISHTNSLVKINISSVDSIKKQKTINSTINIKAIKLDDFIIFKANWKDKVSNIEDIAQELSLGLDSIVFIDDNPIERSWVKSSLPDVIVPECGDTPWEMLSALRSGMYFESVNITKEDVKRHESYKSNLDRKKHERKHKTMESFLEGLEMLAESTKVNPTNLIRATQLINKTNQFNLTTRRYSEEQVKSISESLDYWTRCFYLKDKFGDNGLIGIMIVKRLEESWHIDTFLMSCRVLGRTMEKYMMAELMSDARSENIKLLTGEFIPTKKNALVKNTFKELGFKPFKENIFSITLGEGSVYVNEFIKDNR